MQLIVSICQADYWLPQVGRLQPPSPHPCYHVSICQADYWLPQDEPDAGCHFDGVSVSICQADYWLPQGRAGLRDLRAECGFNLPSRLLASPRAQHRPAVVCPTKCFNLPSRLLASPSYHQPRRCERPVVRFNLPSRLLASPSPCHYCASVVYWRVSICQADYWLPQGGTAGAAQTTDEFQSAKQITGFPKGLPCKVVRQRFQVSICQADYWLPQARPRRAPARPACGFNLPSRLLASPSVPQHINEWDGHTFQSAKQITGFPKSAGSLPCPTTLGCFNLPSRLLASPSTVLSWWLFACDCVSICQADYWLPQGMRVTARAVSSAIVSICQADYWLPQGHLLTVRPPLMCSVSICQADYWLPQVEAYDARRVA